MFFFLIPFFAFLLFLIYSYRKNNLYVIHLVYSIHFWSYMFIWFTVVPFLMQQFNLFWKWLFNSALYNSYDGYPFMFVVLAGIIPYSYFSLKKVHMQAEWITILKKIIVSFIAIKVREWSIAVTYYLAYYFT
ncbi:MAG: hypothetical protein WKF35_06785 [Ferruginibacter sp.]